MNTQQTPTLPRAPITPTLYTMPAPAVLSAEAKAESKGESVALVLCEMCGQPTPQSVIKSYNQIIEELHDAIADKSGEINFLKADKAVLTTENERLNRELMHPDRNGDEDGFWGFVILLLAVVASFGLGCAVGGAV